MEYNSIPGFLNSFIENEKFTLLNNMFLLYVILVSNGSVKFEFNNKSMYIKKNSKLRNSNLVAKETVS